MLVFYCMYVICCFSYRFVIVVVTVIVYCLICCLCVVCLCLHLLLLFVCSQPLVFVSGIDAGTLSPGTAYLWVFRDVVFQDVGFEHVMLVLNSSPISALGLKSPQFQFLRVNQLLLSNLTSSNTTSLNFRYLLLHVSRVSLLETVDALPLHDVHATMFG